MLFSSMVFIWAFLPVVFIGNAILQMLGGNKAANVLLLIASIFFYAWGEPVYVLLMLFSTLVNWIGGLLVSERNGRGEMRSPRARKGWLIAAIVLNLALLGFFKYTAMILNTVNAVTGADFAIPEIALPIGISFFTFQALSYVVDVYRGECETQQSYLKLALYVSFFPQLIAGPIVKYRDIADQIDGRRMTLVGTASGIRRFAYGLAKKVLISNIVAALADRIYAMDPAGVSWSMAWIAAIAYTFQIYYDFSGYSDMAIGLGRMFGFGFRENFEYPYTSLSIREFWRRWHISLSSWFRDYVYIPLGGNRRGAVRTYRNLLIVFMLTGLWHGANWNFVFWGLYHGLFIVLERAGGGKILDRHRIVSWIYTFFVVNLGWVFFRVENLHTALRFVKRMVIPWQFTAGSMHLQELVDGHTLFVLLCAAAGAGFLQRYLPRAWKNRWMYSYAEIAFGTAIIVLSICSLAGNTYNPFIYFRF